MTPGDGRQERAPRGAGAPLSVVAPAHVQQAGPVLPAGAAPWDEHAPDPGRGLAHVRRGQTAG
jgi:hypothetical protein